jgi:hypothetical protein
MADLPDRGGKQGVPEQPLESTAQPNPGSRPPPEPFRPAESLDQYPPFPHGRREGVVSDPDAGAND